MANLAEPRQRRLQRARPARPAYLDYPYTSPEQAFTFWDDYRHYFWGGLVVLSIVLGAYAIWQEAKRFSLFDTLCGS